MSFKRVVAVMGCSLMMLVIPMSQSIGGGPFLWSYQISRLSASALSDDGERFLVGCDNGEYFVFDRYGNLILNRNFERTIHAVDVAENGSMIFGLENGVVFVDKHGNIQSKEYLTEPVLYVSIAKNGLYAVAGTKRKIFLMSPTELIWTSEITIEDSLETLSPPEISISKVAISAQGSSIAVAAQEKVFLFGSESRTYKARIDLGFTVTSLVILPDESEVTIGTEGGTLSLIDIEGKRKFSIPQPGSAASKALQGSISSIAANSEQILVGTSEGKIVLFSRDGNILLDIVTDESVKACDISEDGRFMVILDSEGNVSFFNILEGSGWKFTIRDPLFAELSEDGKYVGITGEYGIYFLKNWENTFESTGYFPYPSRGSFSLKDDLYTVWSYPVEGDCVFDYGDINGDGQNEVVFGSGTELVVLDHRGELVWEESFSADIESVRIHDLTGDAVAEIIIGIGDGKLNMEVWSGEGEHLHNFDFMEWIRSNQEPGIGMSFITAMDIDQDGVVEVVSGVRAGYSLEPRGIFVFEYPSGNEEWFYETAPFELSRALTDINNDGNLELVLGSQSSCDGNAVKDRDDCHVYVMIVDLEGNEIWAKEVGNKFMQLLVAVSDLDSDGQKEIVGTVGSSDDTYGKLFILDSNGKYTYEREFDHSIWFGGIADFEKDGLREIVVTDSEGRVVVYDHKFIPLRQLEVRQKTTPYVKGIADLDGDGTLEIVFVTDSGKLIIMDSSFSELVSMKFDRKPQVTVAKVSGCAVDLLVHSSDKIELYSLRNERTHLCPLMKKSFSKYPEIYLEKAETHYINQKFKESGEYYRIAERLYEEAGNIGKSIESTRMLVRTENFSDAMNKIDSGRKNLEDSDFKKAVNDSSEAKEWLQTIKNDIFEAKILFNRLLEDEEYVEVKEWLDTQIDECEDSLKVCDKLENAFDSFENGKEELERQNYERAREYFMSTLQTFEKYGFEQLSQDIRTSLGKIEEYLKSEEMRVRIYRWSIVSLSWIISSSIIYKSLKYLQDIMYRNENYSTFYSLLYTFHIRKFIKKFPKFSVIKNPYYAGKPIRDSSMFFGRKSIYEFLKYSLVSPGQNPSIILYGERKTGKTSILFQIENGKLNLGPEFIPVYVDMNKMIIRDDYEFLSYVISLIQGTIEKRHIQMLSIPLEERENPHLFFKDIFLRNVVDSVGKKRILFLVDEYEAIGKKVSEGKLSKEILSFLKSVIEPEIKLDFIFTGSRKIEDLKYFDEWSYTLGASVYRKIRFLRKKDATKLIKDPVAEKVWYTNRAVEKLLEISGCHPYILQLLCFNLVTVLNENESFTVDTKEVEEVMRDIIENPMPQLEFSWTRFTKNQQLLVSFLAEIIQKGGDSISEVRIIDEFKAKNVKFPRDANKILNDLEDLAEKDILKRERYRYSFYADIFRQFVAEYYPLERVFQMIGTKKDLLNQKRR